MTGSGAGNDHDRPLVSVVCLTYNQSPYISATLSGFASQVTSFPYEIIVHDDASTDDTLERVRTFAAHYPGQIRVLEQKTNQYSRGIRMPALAFSYARGEFIAYCEGDDYWVDNKKLQRQVEILRENARVGVVFSDAHVYFEETGKTIFRYNNSRKRRIPVGDVRSKLLVANCYMSCTSMFRASAIEGYETVADRLNAKAEDWVMWLYIAANHEVSYMDTATAVYRVQARSASHFSNLADARPHFRSQLRIRAYFNTVYGHPMKRDALKRQYRDRIVEFCVDKGHYRDAMAHASGPGGFIKALVKTLARALFRLLFAERSQSGVKDW